MAVPPKTRYTKEQIDLIPQFGKLMEEFLPTPGSPTVKFLEQFGTRQLERMQTALGIAGRVASKRLQQSLTFEDIELEKDGITMNWGGEDYARFVDEGVNGIQGAPGSRDFGSPYSFRAVANSRSINPGTPGPANNFHASLREWIKFKNIRTITFTEADGSKKTKLLKTEADFNGMAFVLMRSIKRKGIEPSYFISDSFEEGRVMEELDEKLTELWRSL